MSKKFVRTTVMTIVTTLLLFVVSYAWFEGDYRDKQINSNEVNISTSKDLVLSYKNTVYTSLNLSDIISKEFEFGQVSTTGLNNSKFYKVDYTKELDNLPAEYTEAVANEDYLEFNVKITASDTPKRVYLDGVNSGFSNVTQDFGTYTGIKPADCMRCSISFTDSNTSTNRTILLANQGVCEYDSSENVKVYNNCVQEEDLVRYARDSGGNEIKTKPLYVSGQAQYNKAIEPEVTGAEYADTTGVQIPSFFSDFDYAGIGEDNLTDENAILFDLKAYQEKNLTIRIWLDETTIPEVEDSLEYISGQYITFTLRFASSADLSVDYNVKYINPGNSINTINDYLAYTGKNAFSSVVFDNTSSNYKLKNYTISGNNYVVTDNDNTYTYTKDSTNGYYYCTDQSYDKLYYMVSKEAAYVPYSALTWLLKGASKDRDNGSTTDIVSIAKLDTSTNKIIIPSTTYTEGGTKYSSPLLGENFTLVGYYNGVENIVVVNELYICADISEKKEETLVIDESMLTTSHGADCYYATMEEIITTLNNGDESIYTYDDYYHYIVDGQTYAQKYSCEDLNWAIDADSSNVTFDSTTKTLDIENFSTLTGYEDGNSKVYDYVFNITGTINLEGKTYEVINILVVINHSNN